MSRDWSEVKAICEKATPGPWEWITNRYRGGFSGIVGPDSAEVLFPNHCNDGDDGDAWFEDFPNEADGSVLIMARTALPEAIAEIEQLRAVNETLSEVSKAVIAEIRELKVKNATIQQASDKYEREAMNLRQEKAELVEVLERIAYTSSIPGNGGTPLDHAERWLEKSKIARDVLAKLRKANQMSEQRKVLATMSPEEIAKMRDIAATERAASDTITELIATRARNINEESDMWDELAIKCGVDPKTKLSVDLRTGEIVERGEPNAKP